MNRRRFLIALAVAVPVAVFIPAKIAASWRPVALAPFEERLYGGPPLMEASSRFLLIRDGIRPVSQFDLTTGEMRPAVRYQGIAVKGTALWEVKSGQVKHIIHPRLQVWRDGEQAQGYALPAETFQETWNIYPIRPQVQVGEEKIEFLAGRWFCRWDRRTKVLERALHCNVGNRRLAYAMARNGETIVTLKRQERLGVEITHVSTRTGQVERRLSLPQAKGSEFEQAQLSAFGNYALCKLRQSNFSLRWPVINTQTGQTAWTLQFDDSQYAFAVFAHDETLIALPLSGKRWEIRDLRSGKHLRTLPMVPGATSGAFSPDGATLYSVANGVLYRQRAR